MDNIRPRSTYQLYSANTRAVSGKTKAVIMDATEYEQITQAFALLKLLVPAEAKDFFAEFKHDQNIYNQHLEHI